MIKIISCIFIALFCYILWALYYAIYNGCNQVNNIAHQPEYIAYLDDWTNTNLLGKGYLVAHGMGEELFGVIDENHHHRIQPPDEAKSGLPTQYFRLYTERTDSDWATGLNSNNLGLIAFGFGRDAVIMLKNGYQPKYRDIPFTSPHFTQINDGLYAYCDRLPLSSISWFQVLYRILTY